MLGDIIGIGILIFLFCVMFGLIGFCIFAENVIGPKAPRRQR